MQAISVVGADAASVADRLAARVDGRVATVEPLEASDRAGSAGTYALAADGSWTGAGDGRSLGDLLDSLAADHDHAFVAGFPDARLPTVALGGAATATEPLLEAESADALDADAALAALADAEPYESLESLVARVKDSPKAERAGAIATFTGRVRAKDGEDDARTTSLEFEKYEGVAERRLAAIREELEAREGVFEVRMHHRTGVIEDGEDIVFVVVLAGHREEAFRTVEDGINRLKDEVPIFKKEITSDEEFWVHDRV